MSKHKNTPLIVADTSWADTLPEWLRQEINSERLVGGLCDLMRKGTDKDSDKVTDAEVVAYLMTASLRVPLSTDFVNIYLHLSSKVMLRAKRFKSPHDFPDFLKEAYERKLTEGEQQELMELRQNIYHSRGGDYIHPILSVLQELKDGKQKNNT